jgi:alpha-amylase
MGTKTVNFVLAVHNHQPVGNFESVFRKAYELAYLPFIKMLEAHPKIRVSIHNSGPLWEFFDEHAPEYVETVKKLVARGQLELIGCAFYEPILVALSDRDRAGQIRMAREYVQKKFGSSPRGFWLAERVWEQSLAGTLAENGVEYTLVDDTHFKAAGLDEKDLKGYFITEDRGKVLKIFPISKALRYAIPFGVVEKTVEHLRSFATEDGGNVVVYGDDGEKFGLWPETHKHVYTDGWLERFFGTLESNLDWINLRLMGEAADSTPPAGKVYMPDSSYFEMNAWALPARKISLFEAAAAFLESSGRFAQAGAFLKGGMWRYFRIKYPEVNRLYSKMMHVSDIVASIPENSNAGTDARRALYRGQGNDPYWHGVFGGFYLPHLREAANSNLVEAERLARAASPMKSPADAEEKDFDFDGRPEVYLCNSEVSCYVKPSLGGQVYELDVFSKNTNILNTVTRRYEAYHDKVREAVERRKRNPGAGIETIHSIVRAKQDGLDGMLKYDWYDRRGAIDHFFGNSLSLDGFAASTFPEDGDFVQSAYSYKVLRDKAGVEVEMDRTGCVKIGGRAVPIRILKTVSIRGGERAVGVGYRITNLGERTAEIAFGSEWNFAMLGGDAPEFHYRSENRQNLGKLASSGEIKNINWFGICDWWRKFALAVRVSEPADFLYFPVTTVSQAEDGFEGLYQNSCVCPVWKKPVAAGASWDVKLDVTVEFL